MALAEEFLRQAEVEVLGSDGRRHFPVVQGRHSRAPTCFLHEQDFLALLAPLQVSSQAEDRKEVQQAMGFLLAFHPPSSLALPSPQQGLLPPLLPLLLFSYK